jgi:hypothetical protein
MPETEFEVWRSLAHACFMSSAWLPHRALTDASVLLACRYEWRGLDEPEFFMPAKVFPTTPRWASLESYTPRSLEL